MLEIENSTLFPFFTYETELVDDRPDLVVIVAGTFAMNSKGESEVAPYQEPIQLEAVQYPSSISRGLFRESDIVPFKYGGDLTLINAFSIPPSGAPEQSWNAAIRTHHMHVNLELMGPRHWQKSLGHRILSRPEKIDRLQLIDELTYGGSYQTTQGSRFELENTNGCGFSGSDAIDEAQEIQAPQILFEKTDLRFRRPVKPVCFGPVPGTVPYRKRFVGTYDDQWRQTRWPRLPLDFDVRYYSHSPEWLRHPRAWKTGDAIELQNIGNCGRLIVTIPEIEMVVLTHSHRGEKEFAVSFGHGRNRCRQIITPLRMENARRTIL